MKAILSKYSQASMLAVILALISLALLLSQADAEKISSLSFEPPFTEMDNSGHRMVSRAFRSSGSTVVNNNFIRLTPDQQSKKGALWSRENIDLPSFSTIFKFRISGRGKDLFGDGIGIWFVQQGYWLEGELHGFQEEFIGIGIVFDTFKNTENLSAHRDVTILINDGEKTKEMMTKDVKGCNNVMARYHSERADFKITDASLAKIVVENKRLKVFVDARNTGEWTPCIDIEDTGLPDGWAKEAHIGVTAATGQLSDNHDVISLVTYADKAVMEKEHAEHFEKPLFALAPENMTTSDRLSRLEATINRMMNRLEYMDHHFEHHFTTVMDHIDGVKDKVDKREDTAEGRLKDLEEVVSKAVDGKVTKSLDHLDSQLSSKIDRKIDKFEKRLGTKDVGKKSGGDSGWKWPFFMLLFMFLGGAGAMYYFYQKLLKKMHLP